MHTKSGSSIWSRSWTSTGSYCDTNWSHCEHRQTACSESARWGKSQRWRESAAAPPYLLLHRVWQEAAHLPHGLLNLFFCAVLLQEFIHVRHGHLAHLAVGAGFEARLIESNWGGKKEESALWALSTERSLNWSIKKTRWSPCGWLQFRSQRSTRWKSPRGSNSTSHQSAVLKVFACVYSLLLTFLQASKRPYGL